MLYPTKEEILEIIKTRNIDYYVPVVKMWKDIYYKQKWKTETNETKLLSLIILVHLISAISINTSVKATKGKTYNFKPSINRIELGQKASIISTLHEIGHAIYGYSELDACAFSIALFKKVFPTEFKNLEWQGHMLVNKK